MEDLPEISKGHIQNYSWEKGFYLWYGPGYPCDRFIYIGIFIFFMKKWVLPSLGLIRPLYTHYIT